MGFFDYLNTYESKKVIPQKRQEVKSVRKEQSKVVTEEIQKAPQNIIEHANMLLSEVEFDPSKMTPEEKNDLEHYNAILG